METGKIELIEVKGIKALIREGTSDRFIVDEIIRGNAYRKLNIKPDDVIFDIGLNIGMFTILALKKGVKSIYSYEPEVDNFNLAESNIALNHNKNNYKLFKKAVIGNDDLKRNFSINVKKNKGAHSLVEKKGRDSVEVGCINFNKIIEKHKPTVIKMDIEGGEYEIIKNANHFKGVREFILEFHHAHLNDVYSREKYTEVIAILEKHFENVIYRKETKKAWVTLVYCYNEA